MRYPELLVELLREMSKADDGRILAHDSERKRWHHLELLIDAGQVEKISNAIFRITNDGYDFLNAIDKGGDTWDKFLEYLEKGMSYLTAARRVIESLDKLIN